MRLVDGRYVCAYCGAVLDIPTDPEPAISIHGASGKPNVRVITYDGDEVHRCDVGGDVVTLCA